MEYILDMTTDSWPLERIHELGTLITVNTKSINLKYNRFRYDNKHSLVGQRKSCQKTAITVIYIAPFKGPKDALQRDRKGQTGKNGLHQFLTTCMLIRWDKYVYFWPA